MSQAQTIFLEIETSFRVKDYKKIEYYLIANKFTTFGDACMTWGTSQPKLTEV